MADRRVKAMAMAMLALATVSHADDLPIQSQPAVAPCVALLDAEYITPDAKVSRGELAAWLDTILTNSLAAQKNLTILDRQLLDKVLAEKRLKKLDVQTADAAIKPFVASGVLICPTIVADPAAGKAVVTIQAVLAQRGDLLAELAVTGELAGDGWKTPPNLDDPLAQLWRDMRRGIEARAGMPSLEVRQIGLNSKLDRLQWLADDLTDALAAAPREGLVLLVPRQPVHTKEERLLRLMGLSSPDGGDKSAKLAAASDFQLSGELAEDVKPGVPFDRTPIKLALHVSGGGKKLASTELAGTVGQYQELRQQALAWAARETPRAAKIKSAPLDESHAKALAQQELATARRLSGVSYGASAMDRDRRERLAFAALRAAHLDPASEEAAHLAAMSIEGMYEARGQERTLACKDRILQIGRQYLDRFGDKVPKHHCEVLKRMGSAGHSGAWIIRGKPGGTEAVTGKPDARQYPYASAYVRAWMEIGIRAETGAKHYGGTNSLSAAPFHLRLHLIPNIPDDKLDEEYAFWKQTWERVAALPADKAIPWECIDLAFQARRGDAQAVRGLLQKLADKYPQTDPTIWRLTTDDVCQLYLRVVGDSEWRTWRPKSSQRPPLRPDFYAFRSFYRHFQVSFLPLWDYENSPAFDGTLVRFPAPIRQMGKRNYVVPYPRVQFLLVAGDEAWFVAPCLWNRLNNRPHNLLTAPLRLMAQARSDVTLDEQDVTILDWPKTTNDTRQQPLISCHATTGPADSTTVWVGTRNCGLARFDKKDGKWVGRWCAGAQGLPLEITHLATYRSEGKTKLLVEGLGPDRITRNAKGQITRIERERVLSSVDLENEQVTLLHTGPAEGPLAIVWPDGATVPLRAYNDHHSGELDVSKAKEFISVKCLSNSRVIVQGSSSKRRLWRVPDRGGLFIQELDSRTLTPLATPLGKGGDQATHGRGFLWLNLKDFRPTANPIDKIATGFGLEDALWLVTSPADNHMNRGDGLHIMIYRPAAHGDADWARNDLWIGPFKSPDGKPVFALVPDGPGYVWATCADGVYWIDPRKLIEGAIKAGRCSSTAAWRDAYPKRLKAAPWRYRGRDFFANGKHEQALTLIERELAGLPKTIVKETDHKARIEWTDLMLYRAMALGFLERNEEALALLDMLRNEKSIEAAARYKAASMRVEILMAQKRWQSALDEIMQREGTLDQPHSHWSETIARARRELRKTADHTAPPTQPVQP